MTRALTAITALQMGVAGADGPNGGMAVALGQLYEGARRTLLDNALAFDAEAIAALRSDFAEIGLALKAG